MTSSLRIRLAVALNLSVLALAYVTGCGRRAEEPSASHAASATSTDREERFSVYDLASSWRDQTGAERSITTLRGRPVLIAMMYTHCTAVCPLSVSEMKRVEARHPGVRLVLVSLDLDHDSPARLAAYARERGLSSSRWTLLTGSTDAVRDLAATLGVRYRRISNDDFAHSNILTLLDSDGHISRQGTGAIDDDAFAALDASSH